MNELEINQMAPQFSLLNQDNNQIALTSFKGKYIVVYFYPRAMTPGCTVQAKGMQEFKNKFVKENVEVLAISPDTPDKLQKFKLKYGLEFNLLSDPDHKVALEYGAWGLKKFMGKTYNGIFRITFILDKSGKLIHIIKKVKTKTHNQEVLDYIKNL